MQNFTTLSDGRQFNFTKAQLVDLVTVYVITQDTTVHTLAVYNGTHTSITMHTMDQSRRHSATLIEYMYLSDDTLAASRERIVEKLAWALCNTVGREFRKQLVDAIDSHVTIGQEVSNDL